LTPPVNNYIDIVRKAVKPGHVVLKLGSPKTSNKFLILSETLKAGAAKIYVVDYDEARQIGDIARYDEDKDDVLNDIRVAYLDNNVPLEDLSLDQAADVVLSDDLDGHDILSKGIVHALHLLRESQNIDEHTIIIPRYVDVRIALATRNRVNDDNDEDIQGKVSQQQLALLEKDIQVHSEFARVWVYDLSMDPPRSTPRIRRVLVNHSLPLAVQNNRVLGMIFQVNSRMEENLSKSMSMSTRFIPSKEPWHIRSNSDNEETGIIVVTNDADVIMAVIPPTHIHPRARLDASEIQMMTGVQLPERTTIGNGRSLFTFVSTDCTKVTELHTYSEIWLC
jgi:hypothetical protein